MVFAPPKSEYRTAVKEILDPLMKLEKQVRDCIVPLERMMRFRFRSQAKEKEAATYIGEGAAKLAPLIAKSNLDGLADWSRQTEAATTAVAKEE
jgi:hypothetical protein